MKLTPLDIRHKDFKRGMRGYADVEVDEFLDEVADEYERLFKEGIDLKERVETLEEKVAGYRRIEETLQKTLISAQASAEELKQNASKEAQLILHEAELKGRQMVNEAYTERQSIEQAVAKLKSAEQDFRFKFRQLLQGYLSHIEDASVEAAASEAQLESDFARRAEAIKAAISREGAGSAAAEAAPVAPPAPAQAAPGRVAADGSSGTCGRHPGAGLDGGSGSSSSVSGGGAGGGLATRGECVGRAGARRAGRARTCSARTRRVGFGERPGPVRRERRSAGGRR